MKNAFVGKIPFLKAFILGIVLIVFFKAPAVSQMIVPEGWVEERVFVNTAPEPTLEPVDGITGFIPFTKNYMEPIFANLRPHKNEITDTFHVNLARGEYEPFIVCLYALRDQGNIHLEIGGVKSKCGEISPTQFEIRKIEYRAVLPKGRRKREKRYRLIPSLLKLTSSTNLRKGKTSAFWITAHALKESVPGMYSGKIFISKDGKKLRALKIKIRILPFELEEIPDKVFSVLYTPVNLLRCTERNARLLLEDLKAHGMTSYSPTVSAWGKALSFDKEGIPKIRNLVHHLQWAKEEGFQCPTLLNIQKLIRAGKPSLDANYTKFDESVDIPNLRKLIPFLEKEREMNNWPEIIYLPIDEPGSFTDRAGTKREEMALLLLKTLNKLNVRGATTVADLVDNKHRRLPRWRNVVGWWEKMRPYCSVRIYANGYPEGKTSLANEIKDADLRSHEVMLYENSSTMGIHPSVSRMYFGFYGWRTGAKGITSWTYPLFGNATVLHVWSGRRERKRAIRHYYGEKDWVLPSSTVCWEMVREGIDDAKYLYILQKAVKDMETGYLEYLKLIEDLKRAVDSTKMSEKKARCEWKGKQFSYFRERIINAILYLLKEPQKE